MAANNPAFLSQCETGAKLVIGGTVFTKTGALWSVDGAGAKAEVLAQGSLGQSVPLDYVESFTSLAEAVVSAKTNGTVTLVADAATDEILVDKSLTLDLGGQQLTATVPDAVAFKLVAGAVAVTGGTVSDAVIELDGTDGEFTFADSVAFAGTGRLLMTDEFVAAVSARTASVTGFEAGLVVGDGTARGYRTLQDGMDAAGEGDTLKLVNDLALAALTVKTNCVLDCNVLTCRVDGVFSGTGGAVLTLATNTVVRMGADFDIGDGVKIGTARDLLAEGVVKVFEPVDGVTTLDLDALAAKVVPYDPDGKNFTVLVRDGAIWLTARYIVTYDAMDGKWTEGTTTTNIICYSNTGYELPTTDPTRADHEFLGWYTSWTNGAAQVANGMPLDLYTNHTIVAKWKVTGIDPSEVTNVVAGVAYDGGATVVVTGPKLEASGAVAEPLTDGHLILPERIGDPENSPFVKYIAQKAFDKAHYDDKVDLAHKLRRVTLPTYLTRIGDKAFQYAAYLTNVTFAVTRDYKTNEKTALDVGSRAFEGTAVEKLVIPAGATVKLRANSFANCAKLKEICVFGELTGTEVAPFYGSGTPGEELVIRLSPTLAADVDFVAKLTANLNTSKVKISSEPLGKVDILTGPTFPTAGEIAFTFKADLTSPWGVVNERSVTLFYTSDLTDPDFVGTGKFKYPLSVTGPDADGVYTATFEDPSVGATAQFYRLTIGAER